MNKTTIGVGIVALVIGIGVGWLGADAVSAHTPGGQFARGTSSGTFTGRGGATAGTRPGGFGGGAMLAGTVVSESANSLTLNTRDGSSHVVLITPQTTIVKSVDGSLSDLAAGDTVIVSGSTDTSGATTATMIQLRPAGATSPANAPMQPAQ
jgi:hypothetical protein